VEGRKLVEQSLEGLPFPGIQIGAAVAALLAIVPLGTFPQHLLDAADCVALAVQQASDTPEQFDILGSIVTAATATLQRTNLAEFTFPEPEDVLRDLQF
tara:strand:- start:7926 stop:8222 length:297 start_codon:yes stop_codon:yes gene_type:complete